MEILFLKTEKKLSRSLTIFLSDSGSGTDANRVDILFRQMYSIPFYIQFGLEKLKINYRCIVQVTSWIIRNSSRQKVRDLSIVILVTFTKNITEDKRKRE